MAVLIVVWSSWSHVRFVVCDLCSTRSCTLLVLGLSLVGLLWALYCCSLRWFGCIVLIVFSLHVVMFAIGYGSESLMM